FLGEVRGKDKRDVLAASDLLMVPSRLEGFPTVILEGMAAGLPIVATRVGGIPERLTDGENALLCPPNDVRALAVAIERLRADEVLRNRLAAAGPVMAAEHDWRMVGPLLAEALGEATGHSPGSVTVSRI